MFLLEISQPKLPVRLNLCALKQAQAVLEQLYEELCGEKVLRTTSRQYLDHWFNGKKPETAPSPMTFYRGNLAKFVQFHPPARCFRERILWIPNFSLKYKIVSRIPVSKSIFGSHPRSVRARLISG